MYLTFGKKLNLFDRTQQGYLYARGFMNKSILINTSNICKTESQFIILPKMIKQETDNQQIKFNNTPILFGTEICFKHVQSDCFIKATGVALQNLNGFSVELSQKFNEQCVFKIIPLRTFQHEGEPISINSVFCIQNQNLHCFLNVDSESVCHEDSFNKQHYILSQTQYLKSCRLSFDKTSLWSFCFKSMVQYSERKYLNQNQYIYFIHSKDDAVLSVNRENTQIIYQMGYQNDYEMYQSIWEVDYHLDHKNQTQEMRLKHVRSGKYFNQILETSPTKITLLPLLQVQNRLPPFSILVNGKSYNRSLPGEDHNFHGFQITTVEKRVVDNLLSIKGTKPNVWLPYIINYLQQGNVTQKQILLRQFQILSILYNLIKCKKYPDLKKAAYNLLFLVCDGNIPNMKRCCEPSTLQFTLNDPDKQYTSQLILLLLKIDYDIDVIENEITVDKIQLLLTQLCKLQNPYNIHYMKIIRSFCGTYKKANRRNQSILFGYFFPITQQIPIVNPMTGTKYSTRLQISPIFKTRLRKSSDKIVFLSYIDHQWKQETITDISKQKLGYYRQYLYLIARCMKQRHQDNIRQFRKQFSLEILCEVLRTSNNNNMQSLKNPVLNLIKTAYIDVNPYMKCQLNLINQEISIAVKGCLITALNEGSLLFDVLNFIEKQIADSPDYKSTYIFILLQNLKLTIQQGFWRDINDILKIKAHLKRIIFTQIQQDQSEQIQLQKQNLTQAKILAVQNYKCMLDVQISLWVSELFMKDSKKITQIVEEWFYNNNSEWGLDKQLFKLSSETNPVLLQNSLNLFYRLFNLKKQIYAQLTEANQSKPLIKSNSGILSASLTGQKAFYKLVQKLKPSELQIIYQIVSFLLNDSKITKQELINPPKVFLSFFLYKKCNKYYQSQTKKLGLLAKVIYQILKYTTNNIRIDNYCVVVQYFYLLIAIIKDNSTNKMISPEDRKQLIKFVQVNSISFICCQFIEQLYKNNKSLVTSHVQIQNLVCLVLKSLTNYKTKTINFTACKVLNILEMIITLRHKTIDPNKNMIINQILKKEFIGVLDITNNITKQQQTTEQCLFDVILFSLLSSLNQPTLKTKYIGKYDLNKLIALFEVIKYNDWVLRAKTRLYINKSNYFGTSHQRIEIIRSCLQDINLILDKTEPLSESQMFDFERNLKQISQSFKQCLIKMNSLTQDISNQQQQLIIQTYQCFFKIKRQSSLEISNEIEIIQNYFSKIDSKITIDREKVRMMIKLKPMQRHLSAELLILSNITSPIRRQISLTEQKIIQQERLSMFQSLLSNAVEYSINTFENIEQRNLSNQKQIYDLDQRVMKELVSNILQKNEKDTTIFSNQIKIFIAGFLIECLVEPFKANGSHINDSFWFSQLPGEKATQKFKQKQNIFLGYDIPQLVCSFISQPFQQRYSLYNYVLELGICLVFDGHTGFQEKFLSVFQTDRKNTIFTSLVDINNETLKNLEFFYRYQGKSSAEQKQMYPGFIKYQMIIDQSQTSICKAERKDSCTLISKIFRFLQLLCENNNTAMKGYIQNQIDVTQHIKYTSVSFIDQANKTLWKIIGIMKQNLQELKKFEEIVGDDYIRKSIFQSAKKEIQNNICSIPIMIFEFLIEVCQIPHETNQLYLCRTNFFEIILQIQQIMKHLQSQFIDTFRMKDEGKQYPIFFIYQKKIVILIRSLLESNNPTIFNVLQKNFTNEEFQFLLTSGMRYGGISNKEKLNQILKERTMNDQILNIISLLVIKKTLNKNQINSPDMQAISELQSRIRSIEVNFHGNIMVVYFPSHPLFDYIPSRTKDWILYQDCELRTQKLKNMLGLRTIVYEEIDYQQKVSKQIINDNTIGIIFNIALWVSYFVIGLLILFYSVSSKKLKLDIIEVEIVFWVSSVQFLLSLGYFVLWGLLRAPLTLRRIHRYRQKHQEPINHTKLKDKLFLDYYQLVKATYLENGDSMHVIGFLLISVMGVVFDPRWYAFNIFYLFAKLDVLQNIFSALTKNFKQMLVVCLFGGAFIFVFALITLNSYLSAIYQNQQIDIDISREKHHCVSLISCIVSLYTQQIIGQASPDSSQNGYGRFIYDILFIGFFSIFFNNIVSGIMIDKFAQLRDKKEKINNQIKNKCYICSVDKQTLQKMDQVFEKHLNIDHNLWNYYFYLYHLQRIKHPNDFTGIQYWIQSKIKVEDISWFPSQIEYIDGNQNRIKSLEDKFQDLLKLRNKQEVREYKSN